MNLLQYWLCLSEVITGYVLQYKIMYSLLYKLCFCCSIDCVLTAVIMCTHCSIDCILATVITVCCLQVDPQVLGCLHSYWCQCSSQFWLSCNWSTFSIPWLSLGSVTLNRCDICKENKLIIICAPCQFATSQWLRWTVVWALLVLYRSKYNNLLICMAVSSSLVSYRLFLMPFLLFQLSSDLKSVYFFTVNSVFWMYLTCNWVSFSQDNWKILVQSYSWFSVCDFWGHNKSNWEQKDNNHCQHGVFIGSRRETLTLFIRNKVRNKSGYTHTVN